MKILKTDKIRKILNQQWPDLNQIWMFDHKYVCISKMEIENIIGIIWQRMKNEGEKLDCDEQALFLHAEVKKFWAAHHTGNEPLAFGEIAGTMFNAWPDVHNQNIQINEDGIILLIEPQTKEIWNASKTNDKPYWVRF